MLRRKFTKEFKVEACKLVLEKDRGIREVAQNLGIGEGMLGRWVRTYRSNRSEAFPGEGNLVGNEKRIRDLEAEVRRLSLEREILKKAMAYFVEPPK